MILEGVYSTAWAANCAERQHTPLIDVWATISGHVPPQEAEEWLIIWEEPDLVEHSMYTSTDGDGVFSESEKNTQQWWTQCRPRKQVAIQGMLLIAERAVQHYSGLIIVMHNVVWNIP